jgi:AhpD family alkylhydroperoxidase
LRSRLLGSIDQLSKGELSAREIEIVNLYTSELNGCAYCVSAHTALGKMAGIDDLLAIRAGRASNAREQAILDLVRRVVRTGGIGAGTELARAREAGLSDRALMEVLAHVALKAFTNAAALVAQTPIDFPKPPRLPDY